jgi:hypothetical protein
LDISSLHLPENAGRQLTFPTSARILDNGRAEWKCSQAKADGWKLKPRGRELCRFFQGNFAERGSRNRHEIAQRSNTTSRTMQQLLGNALSNFVVTSMRQDPTYLLERDVHVRCYPFVQLFHRPPKYPSLMVEIKAIVSEVGPATT